MDSTTLPSSRFTSASSRRPLANPSSSTRRSARAAINRTEAIDATLALIRAARNRLPIDLPADYVDHVRNVVRFHELDDLGRQTVGYRSLGAIDYLMAELYDYFALRLVDADVLAERMSEETYVRTRFEWIRS